MAMSMPPNCALRRGEHGDDIGDLREIALDGEGFAAGGLDVGHGFVRVGLGRRAVIVDADFRAVRREGAADESAEIFRAAADEDGFSLDRVIAHEC